MKFHKNIMIAALLAMVAGNMQGMEQQAFPFTDLPRELQQEVMVIALNNEINSLPNTVESLKIAAQKIRDLASVNKAFNNAINQPKFCLQIIKNLTKFNGSSPSDPFRIITDEEVAKALGTECAHKRLKLQKQFHDFIVNQKQFSMDKFNDFINKGVDLEWVDKEHATPLILAIDKEAFDAAVALMQKGVNLYVQWGRRSPLTLAILIGNIKLVQALIKYGADVNYIPNKTVRIDIESPLEAAIGHGHHSQENAKDKKEAVAMVKMLLEAGANLDTIREWGAYGTEYRTSPILKEAQEQLNRQK